MLKHISSTVFIESITLVTALYYAAVAALFYRSDIKRIVISKLVRRRWLKAGGGNSV
jgi:hypothetical protein